MTSGTNRRWAPAGLLGLILLLVPWVEAHAGFAGSPHIDSSEESKKLWQTLIGQADTLGLPTGFLKTISPGFVSLEFDDLHAYAAEYHPEEHRMVLNLALSFNAAGGTLKSLAALTPRDVGTLYHELFHAYMDYIVTVQASSEAGPGAARVLAFARDLQECRYRQVSITPIRQKKSHIETRVLTDRESWEALNETWAVFVGWAVWTRLEGRGPGLTKRGKRGAAEEKRWLSRLKKADRDADLIGYYEPEEPSERSMARKRYLAPSSRIAPDEVRLLLEEILEFPKDLALKSAEAMDHKRTFLPGGHPCRK